MEDYNIAHYTELVKDKVIGQWTVKSYINHGKSAAVYKAVSDNGSLAAIKVFDKDIVKKYGFEAQLERVNREKQLVGRESPYLVKIYDGGYWDETGLLYIIMEYLPYKNLLEKSNEISSENIPRIISQIASACEFLETLELAHRDIKLENAVISDDMNTVKVLDLGVLRSLDSAYDHEINKSFIATRRASPPELLFRVEDNDIEAWRAITFYQIGVIIFELLSKKQIFSEYKENDASLAKAVENFKPNYSIIKQQEKPICRALIAFCKICLLKNPAERASNICWSHFHDLQDKCGDFEILAMENTARLASPYINPLSATNEDVKYKAQCHFSIFREKIENICASNTPSILPPKESKETILSDDTFILEISFRRIPIPLKLKVVSIANYDTIEVSYLKLEQWMLIEESLVDSVTLYDKVLHVICQHIISHTEN